VSYLDQLHRALTEVGIRGRLSRRILAEFADHLECDPQAALGDPATIATRFADELGTMRARRAAVASFSALAIAGALFTIAFLSAGGFVPSRLHMHATLLADLGIALALLGPQVAFVAGSLAAGRAWRRRHDPVMSHDESVVIARRAALGTAAGVATMAGLALIGAEARGGDHAVIFVAAGIGATALLGALVPVLRAARLHPVRAGAAGDVFEDLGPLLPGPLRGRPWLFALVVSGALAIVIALAGAVQDDGIDGALRGLLDGAACLAAFAILGRYIGLRS
jgi:hypothetical protein